MPDFLVAALHGRKWTTNPVREWTRRDLVLIVLVAYVLFALVVAVFDSYPDRIRRTGDNVSYASETQAIRGDPHNAIAMHFLGYPLLCAPVAAVLHLSAMDALPIVSAIGSFTAIAIAGMLWGPWAAAWFAVVNLDWIQRSLLGGADPVFAAFVFAALLLARGHRWIAAALFASFATVVRPLGIFALLAIAVVLLSRRRFREFASAVIISTIIGCAYILLVRSLFGHGLSNLTWYRSMGLDHDRRFIPFITVFLQSPEHRLTGKNIAKTLAWTTFTACAVIAALRRPEMREAMRKAPVEWLFGALYAGSFLFFPAWWIEGEYPRYFAPVIPLCLVALRPWLPETRWIVWAVGLASVLLAAVEDMPSFSHVVRALL
jgi:hypothetical protein